MTHIETVEPAPSRDGPEGIGGWLILPVIGLFLTPLRMLATVPETYGAIRDNLSFLSDMQRMFVYAETAFNLVLMIVLPIVLIALLFQKKRAFVRWYVIWAVVSFVGMIIDLALARYLFADVFPSIASLFDQEMVQELGRALVLVVLWVPYMLNSRRVRNTFVN